MISSIKINNKITIIALTILGLIIRCIYNLDLIYWGDETFTFYITDPKISYNEFVERHRNIDDNPIIYFYIIRLLNFLSYSPEMIRLSSVIFGILSIPLSYFFFLNFFNKRLSIFCASLITFNIFLIWQSTEARIASSLVLVALINLNFFFYYLKTTNNLKLFLLSLLNIFTISYYPLLLPLLLTQLVFIFFYKRNLFIVFFIIFIFTILVYLSLNYEYIFFKSKKNSHIGILEYKFFFNYFFRSFFGSIAFGALSLIMVIISILLIKKNETFIKFNLILLILSYVFMIFFSIFKAGIIVPRYFIFLLPSIIALIGNFFNNKKFYKFKYFYLSATILNSIILLDQYQIQRPSINYLLTNIDTKFTKNYFIDEGKLYDKYFENLRILNSHLYYIKKENIHLHKKLYFICFNHPRMHVGTNKNIQNNSKCNFNNKNFKIIEKKSIQDFKIILIEKI